MKFTETVVVLSGVYCVFSLSFQFCFISINFYMTVLQHSYQLNSDCTCPKL